MSDITQIKLPDSDTIYTIKASSLADTITYTNPNLLDNWYFANPINQRKQTSYTASGGYTIDRWNSWNDVAIMDNYITVTYAADYTTSRFFRQVITPELKKAIAGKTVTFSVLTNEASTHFYLTEANLATESTHKDISVVSNLSTYTFTVKSYSEMESVDPYIGLWCNIADSSINIIAAKLEIGNQQTLAHQDNGNWVLNEIPDYGEQLRRCQRYYYRTLHNRTLGIYNLKTNSLLRWFEEFPVEMYNTPLYNVSMTAGSLSEAPVTDKQGYRLRGTADSTSGWCNTSTNIEFWVSTYGDTRTTSSPTF